MAFTQVPCTPAYAATGSISRLTQDSLAALKWSYVGIVTKAVVQFVVGIVLAHLLGPEPFGVYASVLLVTGVGSSVVERGFGAAVIQARTLDNDMIRYAFTRVVVTGLAVSAVLCVVAQPVASLFQYRFVTATIYGSAFYLLVYAMGVIPTALLQRDLDMKFIQAAQVAAYLVSYVFIGIGGALLGWGAWSLIAAQIAQLIIYVLIAYARVRHPVRFQFRFKHQKLRTFVNTAVVTNLLNWAIENLDNLVVGRLYGIPALGLYAVSYNLVRTPTHYVMSTAQGVLFPAAARAQENLSGLQRGYLTAVSAVLLVVCPIFLGMASVAPTVVEGIFGGKWAGAETLLLPLALAMPVHASMTGSALLWAQGQVAAELKVQAGTVLIFLVGLLLASRVSLQAIGWTVLCVYIVRALWLISSVLHSLQLSWRTFLTAIRGGLFLGVVTAGTSHVVNMGLASSGLDPLSRLCVLASLGLVIVTVLPVCVPRLIASPELRHLLGRTISRAPGLLRAVMQLYVKA